MSYFSNSVNVDIKKMHNPDRKTNHVDGALFHYFSVAGKLQVFLVVDPDGKRIRGVSLLDGALVACDAHDADDQRMARTLLDAWDKYQDELRQEEAMPLPEMLAVIVQPWTERERGWGAKDDGVTLHLTKKDRDIYVKDYNAKFNNEASAPDYYCHADGEATIKEVTPELYRKVRQNRPGLVLSEADRKQHKL